MRKLPPAIAAALARRRQPGVQSEPSTLGGEDIGQLLDRLPAMPLSELRPGDAIMLSSAKGSDPARVAAVMLLAGVEPLLTWNLGEGEGAQ